MTNHSRSKKNEGTLGRGPGETVDRITPTRLTELAKHKRLFSQKALENALARLHVAHADLDTSSIFGALGESLWWCVTLDEWWREQHGPSYLELRPLDQDARFVKGVRYIRNRVGHHATIVHPADVTIVHGVTYPVSYPKTYNQTTYHWTWREVDQLPLLPAQAPDNKGLEESYRQYLAGRPVAEALDRCRGFFARLGAWLDRNSTTEAIAEEE